MDNYYDNGYIAGQNEKRAIYRAARVIAVPGILFFLVTRFWGEILLFSGQKLGFAREKIIEAFNEPAVLQVLQAGLSLFLLTVPFIVCAKIAEADISKITALKKPEGDNSFVYFLFGLGFCAFANIAVSFAGRIFESFGIDFSVPESEYPQGVFGFLLVVLSTAVVPALVEEFAFRGIVFGMLKPFGEAFAIFASAAAFGVLHGNFEQMPFAFLVGLALGFVRAKTDSLVICMAIHAANNFIAVLSNYMTFVPSVLRNIIYTVYVMLALTLSVLGVAYLKRGDEFTLKRADTANTTKKVYVYFFFSPAFIIFVMLFLFRAIMYIVE
ncbi:MAG: CPBP family intramembrane metalloprotease [Clostridia bacterium]|nr:CPBP family intramembrane metalloprotease [Clostridia bacterium]